MRIIRFSDDKHDPKLAAVTSDDRVFALPFEDIVSLVKEAERKQKTPSVFVQDFIQQSLPLEAKYNELSLLVPVEAPEVWASGVTYEKSRDGRNYETTRGESTEQTFYDKVYAAERPEIFFKSTKERTVGPNDEVYLRSDSDWQIPEPELGIVVDHKGGIIGYTIGNDMSCRDIEGENPLYLPQAKIWKHSCSVGPAVRLADSVENPYDFEIQCRIFRGEQKVFEGSAQANQLKRKLEELASYLVRDNVVFDGTILLTGTCIVPPNEFTLQDRDEIEIEIPGIGLLRNPVRKQTRETVAN
jgi:2-dehydro-3-deoxy-D-arabinonate dehydratase